MPSPAYTVGMARRGKALNKVVGTLVAALMAIGTTPSQAANFAAGAKIKAVRTSPGATALGALGTPGAASTPLNLTTNVNLSGTLQVHSAPDLAISGPQVTAVQPTAAAAPSFRAAKAAQASASEVAHSETTEGPAKLEALLKNPEAVAISGGDIAKMSGTGASHAGRAMFDPILGMKTRTGTLGVGGILEAKDVRPMSGLQPAGSLSAAKNESDLPAEGVDPHSNDALRAVGLDEQLLPIVEVLQERAATGASELAHLTWALKELIAEGGVVRYAYTYNPETNEPLAGMYNASEKTLYVNDMIRRSDSQLQGAVLAGLLQQAYDHLTARAPGTQEAMAREVRVKEKFLKDVDMRQMAAETDIGSAVSVELFEQMVQTRLWANSGDSTLQRLYGQAASITHLNDAGAEEAKLLQTELAALEDQLRLFEDGLSRDQGNTGYVRQVRVLNEKIAIKKGKINAAERRAEMLGTDADTRIQNSISTPLSIDKRHKARVSEKDLRVVKVRRKPGVEPALESTLALIRDTIAKSDDPEIRGLAYIGTTIDKLIAEGGHIVYAPPGDGAAAYFSPVTLDLVIGREFAKTHPALVAALMVHELTHAADYFGVSQDGGADLQRPLTRETERNAFTNEAIFAGAFDAQELGAALDVRNPMEQKLYDLVFHARLKWVEGKTSLEAMISDAYREMFGAHFSGLQTAAQVKHEIQVSKLAKIIEQYEDLAQRVELTRQAVEAGDQTRVGQLENMRVALSLYEAYTIVYQRQIEQMELEEQQAISQAAPVEGGTAGLAPISSWRHPQG
jgi:hypothetical protein